MRLFHFTGERNWSAIALDREIIPLVQKNERYGRNPKLVAHDEKMHAAFPEMKRMDEAHDSVVWLTSLRHHKQQWMLGPWTQDFADKGAIRIEVDVPDAVPWRMYANRMGIDKKYRDGLNRTGNKEERLWYVVERSIPETDWLEVVRTQDELVLWQRFLSAGAGIPGLYRRQG